MICTIEHALVPGTFDPITYGHIDVVRRARRLFPRVTVAVAESIGKNGSGPVFSLDERVALAREALAGTPGVEVEPFCGLLVDFAHQLGAGAVVKGLRAMTDFEYELQQADLNYRLDSELESIFVMSAPQYGYISSSVVRQISSFGGDVSALVPPNVVEALRARFLAGEATERDVIEGTLRYYTGPGVCPFLGTANTMGCLTEGLGMMLPNGALWPSSTSQRRFSARQTGAAVVDLVRRGIKPSDIMTQAAIDNTVKLLASIGGSLNALIHLPALAAELGLECTWTQVAEITSKTPVICNVVPNGDISCVNLYKAGGIPAVLETIAGDLDTSVMTVTGKTLAENLETSVLRCDRSVIRTQDDPASVANGIQVLYGNLAPEGALVKTSAVPADQHVWSGTAMVFNSEEEAFEAYNAHAIKPGTGVIIRYEGPKGGPGMKELHRVTEIMKGIPDSAVITDGRFSGASGGLSVGYLCPEAFDGAPIALVENGDKINIDLTKNLIEVEVSDEEFARRKQGWKPVIHENGGHLLARYAKQVSSAKTGAVIE